MVLSNHTPEDNHEIRDGLPPLEDQMLAVELKAYFIYWESRDQKTVSKKDYFKSKRRRSRPQGQAGPLRRPSGSL